MCIRDSIYTALDQVIKKALDMRKKEGVSTKKDIMNSLTEISGKASMIRKLSKKLAISKKETLQKRLTAISDGKIDEQRLFSEVAMLADKLDINEEIVRLDDHLKKFKSVVRENGQIAKKLDFIAQEMFREINTIASKSNSSEISHLVVDVKNHIDKIREQCRNVV